MKDNYNKEVYLQYRPIIKNGDVLEWKSETLLGKAIRTVTRNDVNHASQVITFDNFYEGEVLRLYTLEALSHGIELNLISRRLEKFKGEIYWLQLKDEFQEKRPELARRGLERIGIPYDYNSLKKIFIKYFWFGTGNIRSSLDRLYCSEYTFRNGKDSGFPIVDKFKLGKIPVPGEMFDTGWYKTRIKIHDSKNS